MKTLKEEVIELLMKRIGVVEDEEFKASTVDGACATYKISKGKLLFKNLSTSQETKLSTKHHYPEQFNGLIVIKLIKYLSLNN